MNNQQNKSIPIEQGDILSVVVWKIMQDGNWYSDSELWDVVKNYGFHPRSLTTFLVQWDYKFNWFIVKYDDCRKESRVGRGKRTKYYKIKSDIPMPENIRKPNTKYVADLNHKPMVSEVLLTPVSSRVFTNMVVTLTKPKAKKKFRNTNYLKEIYAV